MRGLGELAGDDQGFFGPGTDLVLSLVALLILIVVALNAELGKLESQNPDSGLDIEAVREAQLAVVRSVADTFETKPMTLGPDTFGIHLNPNEEPDIVIRNEATLQRIRFGSHVLFETDEYELQPRGEVVLRNFARALAGELDEIEEVHLQGHADIRKTARYESNLVLASWRAIEVFQFLQGQGIDPTRHLMSAASFAEYAPVARRDEVSYNRDLLLAANDTEEERALNRRIEVILIYALDRAESHSPAPTSTRSTLR